MSEHYHMHGTPVMAQIDAIEPFMAIAGVPVKVYPVVPNADMWAVHRKADDTMVVPNTFVVTRDVGPMVERYQREQVAATGFTLVMVVVSEETANALLSCAEWWQSHGDDPLWPIPASWLAARARVGQAEIDHAR
jgi:hypothetical protein